MRRIFIGTTVALSAIALGVSVLFAAGVVTLPTDGAAYAAAPHRAQVRLDAATTAFTAAPGATYSGIVGSESAELNDFQVTATGDAHGSVVIREIPIEVLRVDGTTYVKGGSAFWKIAVGSDDPSVPSYDTAPLVDQWAAIADDLLGFSVTDLVPRNLGLALHDGADRVPQHPGDASGPASDTPDARGTVVDLPVDIEKSGDVVRAGDVATKIGPTGIPIGVLGRVANDAPTTSRLKVTVMTNAEVLTFYSTVQGLTDPLTRAPLPGVDVPKPIGALTDCGPACSTLTYSFTNSATGGADRGSVTVQQTTNFTVGGASVGSCSRTVVMALNRTGSSTCLITFLPPSGVRRYVVQAKSDFAISAYVEKDVKVIIESLDRGKRIATGKQPGQWYPQPYKINSANRAYDRQITGNTSGFAYVVGGYPFDGIQPDGTLLMTAGPGYDEHVRAGVFDPAWAGTSQLVANARAQKTAAGTAPVRWVFAEENAAAAARKLLTDNKIEGIEVVVVGARG